MDIPTPAYYPYENRSTTQQITSQQTISSESYLFIIKQITMPVYFSHNHPPRRSDQPEEHPHVKLHETEYSTNEGSEFLDDGIRNDEFEPARTEERIAPGSPENLFF
jgi:hypothetical protein